MTAARRNQALNKKCGIIQSFRQINLILWLHSFQEDNRKFFFGTNICLWLLIMFLFLLFNAHFSHNYCIHINYTIIGIDGALAYTFYIQYIIILSGICKIAFILFILQSAFIVYELKFGLKYVR